MEIIFRTGNDKKKQKIIDELNKKIKELEHENRLLLLEKEKLKTDKTLLNKELNKLKRKANKK